MRILSTSLWRAGGGNEHDNNLCNKVVRLRRTFSSSGVSQQNTTQDKKSKLQPILNTKTSYGKIKKIPGDLFWIYYTYVRFHSNR